MSDVTVSIIVPVFKVKNFIERCARSVLEQSLDNIEWLFVNDCSPDGSIDILERVIEDYDEKKKRIRILNHEENKGLPSARNTGIAAARGEYIYHCDSDDWIEKDMLETMFNKAKETDADIVYCDFYLSFAQNERYMSNPAFVDAEDALKCMLHGGMKYNVWNKLIKRSLYEDSGVRFPSDHPKGGEDTTILMLSSCAKKIAYVNKGFYHYDKTGDGAITKTRSDRHFNDIKANTQRTIDFIKGQKGSAFDLDLEYFKLAIKFPFLISDEKQLFELWKEWFPEANKYIRGNPYEPWRNKFLQLCASKGMFFVPKLYYKLIFRLYYGIIYR